jgi:uncharacterized membrane protein (UPF0127 family)
VPESLRGLDRTTVTLDDRALVVAVAETSDARRRGLMGVADLGALDGLLFVYATPAPAAFHMRGVPVPLDIAFFDADGRVLEVRTMPVCHAEPCPTYATPGPIAWALETEAGGLAGIEVGDLLRDGPRAEGAQPGTD